jgi:hypothetical protein
VVLRYTKNLVFQLIKGLEVEYYFYVGGMVRNEAEQENMVEEGKRRGWRGSGKVEPFLRHGKSPCSDAIL